MTISSPPEAVAQIPWCLTKHERQNANYWNSFDDPVSCMRTLHLGFFFDGTRNNLLYDEEKLTHSNVARLYRAFNEEPRSDEDQKYRFATYIPGVGTEFWKQIGDTGIGLHNSVGAATGWGGEARINWALLQLQNNLHRYGFGKPLTSEKIDRTLVQQMSTDISLPTMQLPFTEETPPPAPQSAEDIALRKDLWPHNKVRGILLMQWHGSNVDARRKVLAQRRALLRKKLTPLLTSKLPRIARIRLSVFGFSRGAAEARVFVNWLRDLCDNAKGPMHICGIPAQVDFLGLFDTVASVGAAQSMLEDIATGHGGWARARDLRIPGPQVVARCLHLVAGHEVRGSFPLDAASGGNVEEVVYPGVHSDLGGGYRPGEQGRSLTDSDKLSQIPLCHMYRAAVAAGVPLLDLDQAAAPLREQFLVSEALATRFNAYLAEMSKSLPKGGDTKALVHEHYHLYLRWRRDCLGKLAELPAVKRSTRQDRNDLLEADAELLLEWKYLASTDKKEAPFDSIRNSIFARHGYTGMAIDYGGWIASWPVFEFPKNVLGGLKYAKWKEVRETWEHGRPPPSGVRKLLEEDVHDSRAWFKPFGEDDDVWEAISRERLQYLMNKERAASGPRRRINPKARPVPPPQLTDNERWELDEYRRYLADRSPSAFPSDALPGQKGGREPSHFWGYLRWRTVYQDDLLDHQARHPTLAEASPEVLRARQRSLEKESEKLLSRAERIDQQLSTTVATGGGGGFYMPELEERRSISERQQEIASELKAIDEFLDELGPEPWWSLFD